eukprot:NODE_998_length_2754_cov_0.540113.p3 type:complete len:128 gc:universal NODE_998_length_2754_cov_0.540113:1174-791(-)
MTEVDYLGFKVSSNGIQPTEPKIEAVKAFKPPRNITELRQFVGFTSFCRCFIHKYATLSQPLYELTKKTAEFLWTQKQQQAFETLKSAILSPQILLAHPQYDLPFYVYTDASKFGIGAVLVQQGRPV